MYTKNTLGIIHKASILIFLIYIVNSCDASNEISEEDLKLTSISSKDPFEIEENVYVLREDNFDLFLEQNPTTLIEFYAPW